MSIFDNHIVSKSDLEKFYDVVKECIEQSFCSIYKHYNGDLHRVASAFNAMFCESKNLFEEFSIYTPYFTCTPLMDVYNRRITKILVNVVYMEDPTGYDPSKKKTFMTLVIPVTSY